MRLESNVESSKGENINEDSSYCLQNSRRNFNQEDQPRVPGFCPPTPTKDPRIQEVVGGNEAIRNPFIDLEWSYACGQEQPSIGPSFEMDQLELWSEEERDETETSLDLGSNSDGEDIFAYDFNEVFSWMENP